MKAVNADRRVVLVNRFFFPDVSATSQLLTDLAFSLIAEGMTVTVITSNAMYDRPGQLLTNEIVQGMHVVRVRSLKSRSKSIGVRLIGFLGFYFLAGIWLLRTLRRNDVLIVKTDPPLFLIVAGLIARARGARRINWLQDLYPEVAVAAGLGFTTGRLGKVLIGIRNRSLAKADGNVAIGERMADLLRRYGIAADRVFVIPNWTDDERICPLNFSPRKRADWGLEDKFVVGYSGNLGKAHEINTIIKVASFYRNDDHIRFLFIGGGALQSSLAAECVRYSLSNVVFKPYQPREHLWETLAVPHIHWLTLAPQFEGFIVPSKIYGILAVGRPFIFIGDLDGEIGALARDYHCGEAIRPNDAAAFISAVERMRSSPELMKRYGDNGRSALEARFTRTHMLDRWVRLVRTTLKKSS